MAWSGRDSCPAQVHAGAGALGGAVQADAAAQTGEKGVGADEELATSGQRVQQPSIVSGLAAEQARWATASLGACCVESGLCLPKRGPVQRQAPHHQLTGTSHST
jgi:hypothetical protein